MRAASNLEYFAAPGHDNVNLLVVASERVDILPVRENARSREERATDKSRANVSAGIFVGETRCASETNSFILRLRDICCVSLVSAITSNLRNRQKMKSFSEG